MSVCIEFKDVSYAYPLTNKAAVKHLNCKLESGKCYGIIGPNAGGKTTFCNLMRGLCPKFYGGILKGDVIVNGKSTREWEDEELSVQIGYVFQDPFAQVSGIKETVFEEGKRRSVTSEKSAGIIRGAMPKSSICIGISIKFRYYCY